MSTVKKENEIVPRPEPEAQPGKAAPARPDEPAVRSGEAEKKQKKRRPILLGIVALLVIAGIVFGVKTILFYAHHAETDDAQIEGHIAPVLPKVAGYVTEVLVDDNQRVTKGQVLLRIDQGDLKSKVDTARATLDNAVAAVSVAQANVTAAQTGRTKNAADLERYATLRRKEEVSQMQYDAARAASEAAAAQVQANSRSVAAARAQVAQKKADLDFAILQLSYTTITAPETGIVSRKNVEVGQFVQAGQPLLAIVSDQPPWVIANFKETQLKKMRVGQPVELEVDAYPKRPFHGKIDSISAATGAKFALLPPDNATGNFTKVVQRVPVKVVITDPPDPARPLRAGMSANVIVSTD